LDNTLRFSLLFDFFKGGNKKADGGSSGISLVNDAPKKKEKKAKDEAPKEEAPKEDAPKEMKLQPIEPK
jgi:hypothetical protein